MYETNVFIRILFEIVIVGSILVVRYNMIQLQVWRVDLCCHLATNTKTAILVENGRHDVVSLS